MFRRVYAWIQSSPVHSHFYDRSSELRISAVYYFFFRSTWAARLIKLKRMHTKKTTIIWIWTFVPKWKYHFSVDNFFPLSINTKKHPLSDFERFVSALVTFSCAFFSPRVYLPLPPCSLLVSPFLNGYFLSGGAQTSSLDLNSYANLNSFAFHVAHTRTLN